MPNPWDPGSARYLRHLGFKALATTSSGFAFSRGLPDLDSAGSLDSVLAHIADIVAAVRRFAAPARPRKAPDST